MLADGSQFIRLETNRSNHRSSGGIIDPTGGENILMLGLRPLSRRVGAVLINHPVGG